MKLAVKFSLFSKITITFLAVSLISGCAYLPTRPEFKGPFDGVENGAVIISGDLNRNTIDSKNVAVIVNKNTELSFDYLRGAQETARNYILGGFVPLQMEIYEKGHEPTVVSDGVMEILRKNLDSAVADQNGISGLAAGNYDGAIVVDYRIVQCTTLESQTTGYCYAQSEIDLHVIDRELVRRAVIQGRGEARTTAGPFTTPSAEDMMIVYTANKAALEALEAAWPAP